MAYKTQKDLMQVIYKRQLLLYEYQRVYPKENRKLKINSIALNNVGSQQQMIPTKECSERNKKSNDHNDNNNTVYDFSQKLQE